MLVFDAVALVGASTPGVAPALSVSTVVSAPMVAAYQLVTGLDSMLQPIFGTASAAIAIILFTLAVRAILLPLAVSQARAERARAALQPQVRALQRRYRKDPARQQREIAAAYRAAGTSAFAGCLPSLAQWPFFMVMYRLFVSATVAGHANAMLLHAVLGQNLAAAIGVYGLLAPQTLLFAGILVLMAAVAWRSSRRMRRVALATASGEAVPGRAGRMGAVMRLLPYGTVLVAMVLPLAAALYLLTTTAWTAAQRAVLHRYEIQPA